MSKLATIITVITISAGLPALTGCGSTKAEKKKDEFFTSGSREADQRATQRMAKEEQLGSGTQDKNASKGKPGEGSGTAQGEKKQTLFERLGGEQGVSAIVDDFTARALEDPRVNWQRKGVTRGGIFHRDNTTVAWNATPESVAQLKTHIVQFIAIATGGPPKYEGKEIKQAHAGLHITNPEFDAAVGDLKAALDKLNIGTKEQKELLAIIESTRPQIVTER
jgi:hemoglobin